MTEQGKKVIESDKKPDQEYGGTGFIVSWTILIVLALVLAFTGRLFGYEDSPLSFHTILLALFTAVTSVICIAMGIYVYLRGKAKDATATKRNGVMLFVLGFFMLGGFFMFEEIIPLVFG